MALRKSLLAFIIFLSLEISSLVQTTTSAADHRLDTQALLSQICTDIENQNLCLSNVQDEVNRVGRPPHDQNTVLRAAIKATLDEAKLAIEMITKFTDLSVTYREQVAIEDCKELLDFSVTELAWSLGEMERIRSGSQSVHYGGNLKAWLSAALSNQDTCLEGFEGTDGRLQSFVRGSLKQVTQLIGNVLTLYSQMHSLPFRPPRGNASSDAVSRFPSWMNEGDQQLLTSNPLDAHIDAIVASDGSGHYLTITEAIDEAPAYSSRRYVIYIKRGVYSENIDMKKKKTNIMLVGDGIGATIVTGNRNFMQGMTTFRTATVAVSARGFIAREMTFRNTAGPENHQAVALRVDSDLSAFYRCSMEGYQDTLYTHSLRQFYRECHIYGTIDFIFGNGAVILQNCYIHTRVPLPLQKVTITAQGRKSPDQSTGIVIQDSQVLATRPTYLGRPWKQYSRTVYMNTYMSSMVQPRGWLEWIGDFALNTLWYGEYKNYGPGAGVAGRVEWPGYRVIEDTRTAEYFTVRSFIDGGAWLPSTGIKFTSGLTN